MYFTVFAAGMISTLLLTPVFRKIAAKCGFMDCPANNHKGHGKATPLLGGAAMFTGWIICLAAGVVAAMGNFTPFAAELQAFLPGLQQISGELAFIVAAGTFAVLLGLIDDKFALKASTKFAGQFIVAIIAVMFGGVRVNAFLPEAWMTFAVSVFWIMLMMNSINFFDNMDGLAVGTIAIAMLFFGIISAISGQVFCAAFTLLTFGVCCGFWFYNANPATIFMGDSGSHFLGFLAAVAAAKLSYFQMSETDSFLPIFIPLMILALPLFDTAMVVAIRTWNRKPFWIGDHNHISHRFTRMGMSRKLAVFFVHLLALMIALGTLPMYWGDLSTQLVIIGQTVIVLIIITTLQMTLGQGTKQQ